MRKNFFWKWFHQNNWKAKAKAKAKQSTVQQNKAKHSKAKQSNAKCLKPQTQHYNVLATASLVWDLKLSLGFFRNLTLRKILSIRHIIRRKLVWRKGEPSVYLLYILRSQLKWFYSYFLNVQWNYQKNKNSERITRA